MRLVQATPLRLGVRARFLRWLTHPLSPLVGFAFLMAAICAAKAASRASPHDGYRSVLFLIAGAALLTEAVRPGWALAAGALALVAATVIEAPNRAVGVLALQLGVVGIFLWPYWRYRPPLLAFRRDFHCPVVYMAVRLFISDADFEGERRRHKPPPLANTHPWNRYFNRPLRRKPTTLHDLARFLSGCRYLSDRRSRSRDDYWEPPDEFEIRRKGDCDDHAVYAWRVLTDLGYATRLILGEFRGECHAWVHVAVHGRYYLIEPTWKHRGWPSPADFKPLWSIQKIGQEFAFFHHGSYKPHPTRAPKTQQVK
jgi:hypothetical protein